MLRRMGVCLKGPAGSATKLAQHRTLPRLLVPTSASDPVVQGEAAGHGALDTTADSVRGHLEHAELANAKACLNGAEQPGKIIRRAYATASHRVAVKLVPAKSLD